MTLSSPEKNQFRNPPRGMSRTFLRLPILLYRLNLGWLMGHRFLLLTHTGRKSGQHRQTVLEVIRYDPATRTPIVVSGFGPKSDWVLNVRQSPGVKIHIGRDKLQAQAVELSPEEAVLEFRDYGHRHPRAMKALAGVLDYPWDGNEASHQEMAQLLPVLRFLPVG